jgi:uncharacterized protein (TIGR02246 family)
MYKAETVEDRLPQIEDRVALRDLISQYNFSIDDRDLKTVADQFVEDGFFGSLDGVMGARGRESICKQFEGRFSVLGATNHFSHDQVVEFTSPTTARGQVASHAEVWRNERAMLTALRYTDEYQKGVDGKWRFVSRKLSFMYYVNIEDYATLLGQIERNCAGPTPVAADWPENTSTYIEMRPSKS